MNVSQFYEVGLFNWSCGGFEEGHKNTGKHCIAVKVREPGGNHYEYLDKNLNLQTVGGGCWYTTQEIAEILTKLNHIKSNNIPKHVEVGQVYKIEEYRFLICSTHGEFAATIIDICDAGCHSSIVGDIVASNCTELRELLVSKNAQYLGKFSDLFEEK
jgi:hypothetical protein